ncbi:MAG: hypothetical protein COT81_01905 [Candidatus Buchananbacteria bacterium CG10_big_fil_rev_8_21_14_0_10_42_9]|uniref:Capsule polysaccharide biosynthesis protein n=1 Tax=Candidatus Buchananbacteria bacterium CG10_big_fil_rev_8_21_14_0_10_42_9 TaxID=1974526 RepID=A0A2H0W1Q8_9BACT|nr:MAG: hypothetical protein COT81_01905 [Candidatus Buchananbacteria bacterium CG10_big_fil_rev_8_21_14_0_10_42_9]
MASEFSNKRVLIFQQRGWGFRIGHYLAKRLVLEGAKIGALTFKRSTHNFIVEQKEVQYEMIINHDDIMSDPKSYLAGEHYSLEEIGKALGIDSMWQIIATSRRHTRSYKDKFYYSYRQNVSDEEILDYVMAAYKCIKSIFEKFKPEVIIVPNFPDVFHIMCNLYAEQKGVTMLAITDPRIKGYNIFTHYYKENKGLFYDHVDALNAEKTNSPNRDKAKKYIQEFRAQFKKPYFTVVHSGGKTFKQWIKYWLKPWYHIWLWYTTEHVNYIKSTGISIDYRPPRIILRDFFASRRYARFMDKYEYYPFDQIKKFVYFPLQFQPEAVIDVAAPYYSNQIETARQIAMSLPGDYTLVVKEHPAMVGLRSPSYIEKLARTINVKLIDYRIPTQDVLKRTDLVISPNGTTLVEAAFYNKPAIQLGNLGTMLKLPNVFQHSDITTITSKIKELLKTNLQSPEYEQKLENYVAAVMDTGLEFNYYQVWEQAEKGDMEKLWQFYRAEIKRVLNI